MKHTANSKLTALCITAIGVVWLLVIMGLTDLLNTPEDYMGAVVFGLLAIVVADLYLLVFRVTPGAQSIEVGVVGIYYTAIYIFVLLLANSLAIYWEMAKFGFVLTAINLLLNVGYIVIVISIQRDTQRLIHQQSQMSQVTAVPGALSRKLGTLLAVAEDEAVRARLLKLKEAVDYGNNVSSYGTYELETKMDQQLETVLFCLQEHMDTPGVMKAIGDAEITWKMRSNATSTRG